MRFSTKYFVLIGVFFLLLRVNLLAQNDSTRTKGNINYLTKGAPIQIVDVGAVSMQKYVETKVPSTAALYSAILPGLGQVYNKKYWKVPLVMAAIGGGIYAVTWNQKNYDIYLDAYRIRLSGGIDDYFDILKDEDQLIAWMDFYRNQRDLSIFITIGIYAFNILDAYVDAHLINFNIDENLSLKVEPTILQNSLNSYYAYGLRLSVEL